MTPPSATSADPAPQAAPAGGRSRTAAASGTAAEAALAYRPDIDGLRSVAVVSVLLFHLGLPGLPAGFVGVDIFFVISGFLIVSILVRDLDAGRFSLAHFYRRRALRILPPIFIVLAATTALAALVLLPDEIRTLGRTAVSTLLFVSNIFFWRSVDYFTDDAKANPLLHTWSLGVEEQFYILVPVLLWLAHRYARRHLVWLFAATVAISFGLSLVTVGPSPRATFYLLPPRYWELGLGALLALSGPGLRIGRRVAVPLSLAGAALIGYALFGLDAQSPFPGANALWPCLGAACLIAAGENGPVGRLLARPLPVWIGRISYSLYLWHWPLIVLFKLRFGPHLTPWQMLLLGGLAVALAALSTSLVERPIRAWRGPDRPVLVTAGLAIAIATLMSWGLVRNPAALRDYPEAVLTLDRYAKYSSWPEFGPAWRAGRCHLGTEVVGGFSAYDKEGCLADGGRPALLVMGDSHAAHLVAGLIAARPDLAVLQGTSSQCRPLADAGTASFCTRLASYLYHDWIPEHRPGTVLLSAVWDAHSLPSLAESIRYLRGSGVQRVIVLGVSAAYTEALPKLLARDILFGGDRVHDSVEPGLQARNAALRATVLGAGAEYVDLLDVTCPGGTCLTEVDGAPLLFDSNHFTLPAARFVARSIADRL